MAILNKLASALNRRDEVPNQALAQEIARTLCPLAFWDSFSRICFPGYHGGRDEGARESQAEGVSYCRISLVVLYEEHPKPGKMEDGF